jgi:hypothetical protein
LRLQVTFISGGRKQNGPAGHRLAAPASPAVHERLGELLNDLRAARSLRRRFSFRRGDVVLADQLAPRLALVAGELVLARELDRLLGQSLRPASREWDYWPHTRSGHRVTVKGDRPF